MHIALRILLLLITLRSAYYFTFWLVSSLIPIEGLYWIKTIGSLCVALLFGWFVWSATKNKSPEGLLSTVFLGAVTVGSIGFFGGFFGPIILFPSANQGPLLGIFITGPIGFILGGVGGFIYCLAKNTKFKSENNNITSH